MSPRPFEPGWEIGILEKEDADTVGIGVVKRVTAFGKIIVEDSDGEEKAFEYTGIAEDCDNNDYPRLVPLTRTWRMHRRHAMMRARLSEVSWNGVDAPDLECIYEILDKAGYFEWRDDTEEDYSDKVSITE